MSDKDLAEKHHEWSKDLLREAIDYIDDIEAGISLTEEFWNDVDDWRQRVISHIQQTNLTRNQ